MSTGSKNASASYKDGSVVIDGKIVTSRNPDDIPNFIDAIAQKLIS
nr:DJ-1/PfpI family protein [Glaciecola punicea]